MAKASIQSRLEKLDRDRKFLHWFALERLLTTLTDVELTTWASGGDLPDPIPNRPSRLDTMSRESLRKLWEENQKRFGARTEAELEFYADNGFFPEEKGRLHYFMENGRLQIEWRSEVHDRDA